MGLFSTILSKLGLGHNDAAATPAAAPTAPTPDADTAATAVAAPPAVAATSEVDVVSKLDGLAAADPQKLNWKVSIVDLLKLLGLDSSLNARKELAQDLGYPAEKVDGSAEANEWLHAVVLQKLAENGGNIPPALLQH
jgi:hypothetical protein